MTHHFTILDHVDTTSKLGSQKFWLCNKTRHGWLASHFPLRNRDPLIAVELCRWQVTKRCDWQLQHAVSRSDQKSWASLNFCYRSSLFTCFTAAEASKDKQATHSKKGWLKVNGKRFCCRARFGANTALVFQHVGTICCPSKHCDTQYYFKLLFKTVIYIIYGWYYDNVA